MQNNLYFYSELKTTEMRNKESIEESNIELRRINKALPSGGVRALAASTNLNYYVVYRTLQGTTKHWDKRHDKILKASRALLKDAGVQLIEA